MAKVKKITTRYHAGGGLLNPSACWPGAEPPAAPVDPRRVAVHEAGHAVLACLLGLKFEHVTIRGQADGNVAGLAARVGHCERFGRPAPPRPPAWARGGLERRVYKILIVMNAGLAAETLALGDGGTSAVDALEDRVAACELLSQLYDGDVAAVMAHVQWSLEAMPAILTDPAIDRAIRAVADELARVKTLAYAKVRQLVWAHTDRGRACKAALRPRRFPGLCGWIAARRKPAQAPAYPSPLSFLPGYTETV